MEVGTLTWRSFEEKCEYNIIKGRKQGVKNHILGMEQYKKWSMNDDIR